MRYININKIYLIISLLILFLLIPSQTLGNTTDFSYKDKTGDTSFYEYDTRSATYDKIEGKQNLKYIDIQSLNLSYNDTSNSVKFFLDFQEEPVVNMSTYFHVFLEFENSSTRAYVDISFGEQTARSNTTDYILYLATSDNVIKKQYQIKSLISDTALYWQINVSYLVNEAQIFKSTSFPTTAISANSRFKLYNRITVDYFEDTITVSQDELSEAEEKLNNQEGGIPNDVDYVALTFFVILPPIYLLVKYYWSRRDL